MTVKVKNKKQNIIKNPHSYQDIVEDVLLSHSENLSNSMTQQQVHHLGKTRTACHRQGATYLVLSGFVFFFLCQWL